jgi:hypothetical protein
MSIDRTVRRPTPLRAVVSRPLETVRPPEARRPPWLVLAPADAVELRSHATREAQRLVPGTWVVLVANRPLARRHLRQAAQRAGISVHRELVVLPSTRHPLVVVDDDDECIALFWQAVAMVPPGLTHAHGVATLVLRVLTRTSPGLTSRFAPGRILIGQKT